VSLKEQGWGDVPPAQLLDWLVAIDEAIAEGEQTRAKASQ
jgi:hypothetical protein